MRILVAAIALLTVACTPAPTPVDPTPAPPSTEAPASVAPASDEAACTSRGGAWQPVCRMQNPACVMTFADAGKACSDGDDCMGDCLSKPNAEFAPDGTATVGMCASNDDLCGCKQRIEDGQATGAICVD